MIGYETPPVIGMIMFVVLLLTAAFQAVIALEAGELIREKRALGFIRLLYSLLAMISAVLLIETLLAIASVEGGIFFDIPVLPRYVSVLPAVLFLSKAKSPVELPSQLRPVSASFFVPLLRLPLADLLPMPLPVIFAVFASVWFVMDTVWMLLSFRAYARTEITRSVMPDIIRRINHGICIASRKGWILECNPAFYSLCERIGIHKTDQIDAFEAALKELQEAGRLDISYLENGMSLRVENGVYFLQRSSFKSGGRTFVQIAFSDVTKMTRTAAQLEQENEKLAQENRELERIISDIALEEIVCQRERLCRAAHDLWAQRLAVAGLLADMILGKKETEIQDGSLEEIISALEVPAIAGLAENFGDLTDVLRILADMYDKLGVELEVSGQAEFSRRQQEVLCAVFREALTNAVRHAYARNVCIMFMEDREKVGVTIQNVCLDDSTDIAEGRGMHDMKTRVREAGGAVQYEKSNLFELQITFPKNLMTEREVCL